MTAPKHLALAPPSEEYLIRETIRALDDARKVVAKCEALLAIQARAWADARGLTVRPRIEQLRREVGCG